MTIREIVLAILYIIYNMIFWGSFGILFKVIEISDDVKLIMIILYVILSAFFLSVIAELYIRHNVNSFFNYMVF